MQIVWVTNRISNYITSRRTADTRSDIYGNWVFRRLKNLQENSGNQTAVNNINIHVPKG